MSISARHILRNIAERGTAPDEGCARFGVGYDDAFSRLRKEYLEEVFEDGGASCKVVVGEYGSGKTHFLRHFSEFARSEGCVTAFVKLNANVVFTENLTVYRQVAKALEFPNASDRGVGALLWKISDRLDGSYDGPALRVHRLAAWVNDDDERIDLGFENQTFARVAKRTLRAMRDGDVDIRSAGIRWLEGNVTEAPLAKQLSIGAVRSGEAMLYGREALLSLFQLIHLGGFPGTVVCFDEAEQSINLNKSKKERILLNLRATADALADSRGSALVFFAITPEVEESVRTYPALQGVLQDPAPGRSFWEGRGNIRASKIDMNYRDDPVLELERIGLGLVAMLYNEKGELASSREDVEAMVRRVAEDIVSTEPRSSARRTMAKRAAFMLMELYDHGDLRFPEAGELVLEEPEV